jgi:hypothetical protein
MHRLYSSCRDRARYQGPGQSWCGKGASLGPITGGNIPS